VTKAHPAGETKSGRKLMASGYPRLLAAYGVSVFGDLVYKIVLMWWIAEETGSLISMASVAVAASITSVVLSTVAGTIADLVDKRKFMIAGDAVRGAILMAMAFQLYQGALTIPYIIVYTVLLSAVHSVYFPALMSWMPELIESSDLVRANAGFEAARNLGRCWAPSWAGWWWPAWVPRLAWRSMG